MFRSFLLLPFILLTGCASIQNTFCNLLEPDSYVLVSWADCPTQQLSFDHDAEADFSTIESYAWMPVQIARTHDDVHRDESLLSEWVTDAVDKKLAEKGLRFNSESPDFLVSYEVPVEMQATMTLVFTDAASRQPIWRGVSNDDAYPARNRDAWEKRVRMTVNLLLEQFPPSGTE